MITGFASTAGNGKIWGCTPCTPSSDTPGDGCGTGDVVARAGGVFETNPGEGVP